MMKKIFILTLILSAYFGSYAQVNFCPKTNNDWTKALLATPDFELPILNVVKLMGREHVKSIKIPELIIGTLTDNKIYTGYSENNIYRINIDTEEIQSFPHEKSGVLPDGEKYEWKTQFSLTGDLYMYKQSKKTTLPLNIYKANFSTNSVDLIWETGIMLASNNKLTKGYITDHWFWADDKGNVTILDLNVKQKILDHKFNVPAELTSRENARFLIDFGQSMQGSGKYQCDQVHYSLWDFRASQCYFAQYDVGSKQTIVSQLAVGHVNEWISNNKSYWVVSSSEDNTSDLTIFNDNNFSDVRFKFSGLKKGVGYNLKYFDRASVNPVIKNLIVKYDSRIETYDWATKKLLKTESAAVEISDF